MRRPPIIPFAALCLTLAVGGAAGAQPFREVVLDNGLRVILVPQPSSPMVVSSVVVGSGVTDEPPGMHGVSHFLEHLLFNGTERRTQRELYDEVDFYGAYNNATTREDHTLYMLLVQREFAAQALDIQADMLFNSTLPPDKFEKEKGIVIEELARDRQNPAFRARELYRAHAYAGTPLARTALGTEASIEALQRDAVFDYYRRLYRPDNMTLVVLGDFEPDALLEHVTVTFGAAPRREDPLLRPDVRWPALREQNLQRAETEGDALHVLAGFRLDLEPFSVAHAAAELWVRAHADGADAPLQRRAAELDGVRSVAVTVDPRRDRRSTVVLSAELAPGTPFEPLLQAWADVLRGLPDGLGRERIAELLDEERARTVLTAEQIHYVTLLNSAYVSGAPAERIADPLQRLEGIDDETLQRAARLLASGAEAPAILAAGPGLVPGLARWQPAEPAPHDQGAGSLRHQLDNGLRMTVVQDGSSRVFALQLLLQPRVDLAAGEQAAGAVELLHRLYTRGSREIDAGTFESRLRRAGAQIKWHDDPRIPFDDYYTVPEHAWVRLEVPASRWREALVLLAAPLTDPRWTEDDLQAARAPLLQALRRDDQSSRRRAEREIGPLLAGGHPLGRRFLGSPTDVAELTLEQLQAVHARQLTGRRMTFGVVGPIAPALVRDVLAELFGDLPSGDELDPPAAPAATEEDRFHRLPLGGTQSYVLASSLLDVAPEDRAALQVAVQLLSDRLAFEIRETRGLAYSMRASLGELGGRSRLNIGVGTRSENIDTLLEAGAAEVDAFAASVPHDDDVRRAINALRGRWLMRRMTSINRARDLALETLEGEAPGARRAALDACASVASEDVMRVARRYLGARPWVTVVVE